MIRNINNKNIKDSDVIFTVIRKHGFDNGRQIVEVEYNDIIDYYFVEHLNSIFNWIYLLFILNIKLFVSSELFIFNIKIDYWVYL